MMICLYSLVVYRLQISFKDPKISVQAHPESVNVLPGYGDDPRTPEKLVDGVYLTADDVHVWLAPWMPETSKEHYITMKFDANVTLSMLRICES